jgi:signal peptidase II
MSKWKLAGLVSGAVVLADQLTKLAIIDALATRGRLEVISGYFDLVYTLNTGVSFGMFAGSPSIVRILALSLVTLVALSVVIWFIRMTDNRDKGFIVALAMVAGGAIGNLIDRVRLGGVVDFLDVYAGNYHWPAFNVADAGITIGTGLILLCLWRTRHRSEPA